MSGYGCAFNCDRCGRFMNPDAPGASFSRTWYEDGHGGELRDPEFRCSPCTDKHGVGYTNCAPGYPGSGRNPLANADVVTGHAS